MKIQWPRSCCLCGATAFTSIFTYTAPPEGEVRFQFSSAGRYQREVLRCGVCGHFVSIHAMDAGALYTGDYVNSNYGDDGIRRAFERIVSLDPSQSDNVGRVRRIVDFMATRGRAEKSHPPSVLDVGSGLCVFLHRMKAAGWECTALDPDDRAVAHAREVVGVNGRRGNFMEVEDLGRFDLLTFNKVLEHVEDPVQMLSKSKQHLRDGGVVYVEVPDGEMAMTAGAGREEFFIDHHHVFSLASLALMIFRAGFSAQTIERLREPSSKYTLRAFLTLCDGTFGG